MGACPVRERVPTAGGSLQATVMLLSGDNVCVDGLPVIASNHETGREYSLASNLRCGLEQLKPPPIGVSYYFFEGASMLSDADKIFADRTYQAVLSEQGVKKFSGFTEHAYRLVFFYGQKYATFGGPWHLR